MRVLRCLMAMRTLLAALTLTSLLAGCYHEVHPARHMTDDARLAQALLDGSDLASVTDEDLWPLGMELNGRLDPTMGMDYDLFVAQQWIRRSDGSVAIVNAITQYPSARSAEMEVEWRADKSDALRPAAQVGGRSVAYEVAHDDGPSDLVFRFTYGRYMVKVETRGPVPIDDLQALAEDLARVQVARMERAFDGQVRWPATQSMEAAPWSWSRGTYLGTVPVSEHAWIAVMGQLDRDRLEGFVDAAASRFLTARPGVVAEAVVFHFASEADAQRFYDETVAEEQTSIPLPADLQPVAYAILFEGEMVELQAPCGPLVLDVAVFPPFDELGDQEAAEGDMIHLARAVLTGLGCI